MEYSHFVTVWIGIVFLGSTDAVGTVNGAPRYISSFRLCVDRCISKYYHGPAPSIKCSFTRSANRQQTWNGPPTKVITVDQQPIYGQGPLNDGTLGASDVKKTSTHLSRVIRGIFLDRRKASREDLARDLEDHHSSEEDDGDLSTQYDYHDYVTACYNCVSSTCRFSHLFG